MTIAFRDVTFTYPQSPAPALRGVDLEVETGEVLLVAGNAGSGKSTLLRAINGLVPHATGGTFAGDVATFGRSIRTHRPRDLADVVGFVHQDPEAQFVVDRVEADVAFVLENLGADPVAMRRRVEEVLDALGVAHLRHRSPATLSGGERQRCAIAGALAAAPAALVLDEPTSQLDPQGADDVLSALLRLNADLGTTIVLAEHRLERAGPLADRAAIVDAGAVASVGEPGAVLATYEGAPQVTRLGALLGWDPLPLTVRDARRQARRHPPAGLVPPPDDPPQAPGVMLLGANHVRLSRDGVGVLHDAALVAHQGEVVTLMGRNGAGKTSLLRVLAGLAEPDAGEIVRKGTVAYVPQDPNALLFATSVRGELEHTLRLLGRDDPAAVDRLLDAFGLTPLADRHPRSLSGGERQRVAIAAVAVGGADVLLLDEPTRGMDAASMAALEQALRTHTAGGGAAVVATHDVRARRAPGGAGRRPRRRGGRRGRPGPAGAVRVAVRAAGPARPAAVPHRRGGRCRAGGRRMSEPLAAHERTRARLVYGLMLFVGAAAFLWPFFVPATALPAERHAADAPLLAALVGGLVVVAVLVEIRTRRMNGATVALLGVLAASAGLLRLVDLPGGGSGIFFLVVLAGAAFGPRFGLLLGMCAMVVSAVVTGGVGPWLPFQMLALGWMGGGAGVVGQVTRRWHPRAEVALLAVYGWVWGFAFGAIMNLWFWPFVRDGGPTSYAAGLAPAEIVHRYIAFYAVTSFGWDAAGALANAAIIVLVGRALLASMRRFAVRLDPDVAILPEGTRVSAVPTSGKPVEVRR